MGEPQQVESERVDVGNTSSIVTRAAPTEYLYFFNSSTGGQYITLCLANKQAVPGEGIVLPPTSGHLESNGERFTAFQGDVKAIAHDANYATTTGGKLSVTRR